MTLWTVACQAPLSIGFPKQEHWSELPFPPLGDLPDLCLLRLLRRQADSLPVSHLGSSLPMVQLSSGPQSRPTLCDLMNRSTPGLPVHHQLPMVTAT